MTASTATTTDVDVVRALFGAFAWVCFEKSGVDPVVVGLVMGMLVLAYPAPRARLVPRDGRAGRPRTVSAGPGPRCAPRHQEQHEDERDDDPLMHQRRPEGGDDCGISGVQPRVHAWHGAILRPR